MQSLSKYSCRFLACAAIILSIFFITFSGSVNAALPQTLENIFSKDSVKTSADETKKTDAKQPSAQELQQAVTTLTKIFEDKKQQQLLQQLKQLQGGTEVLAKQKQTEQDSFKSGSIWLFDLFLPNIQNTVNFWQKRFDGAKLELIESYDKIFSWRLVVVLILAILPLIPLSLWLRNLSQRIANKYSFNQSSRLSKLFSKHYLKRLSSYMLKLVVPVMLLMLLSYYVSILLPISAGMVLDETIVWFVLLRLANAVLFTILLVLLFPLLIQTKNNPVAHKFKLKISSYILILSWLIAWDSIFSLPQLAQLYGDDLFFVLRTGLNVVILLFIGYLVFYFKPVISFLIMFVPYEQRHQNKKISHIRRILATGWFVPLLFLIGISLFSMLAGDAQLRVFNQSIITSLITFIGITVYILLGHFIRIKEDHQILTVYQETANRLRKFVLIFSRIAMWFMVVDLLLRLWGYSFQQLESLFGFVILRPILVTFVVIAITWLAIIVIDNYINQYLLSSQSGENSARIQTILPLISNCIKIAVLLTASLVLMVNLGLNITPLLAGAGILGLAIGFGAQSLVLDIITGIFILIEDSISVGEYIITSGHAGTVERFTLRTISLRDLDGVLHVLPFSQVKGVQNLSREVGYTMLRIPVPYEVSVDTVIELLEQSVAEVSKDSPMAEYIWSDLEVQGIENFSSGIAILRGRIETTPFRQWQVSREIHLNLKRRFERHGIQWAVPHVSINNNSQIVTNNHNDPRGNNNNLNKEVTNLTSPTPSANMIPQGDMPDYVGP